MSSSPRYAFCSSSSTAHHERSPAITAAGMDWPPCADTAIATAAAASILVEWLSAVAAPAPFPDAAGISTTRVRTRRMGCCTLPEYPACHSRDRTSNGTAEQCRRRTPHAAHATTDPAAAATELATDATDILVLTAHSTAGLSAPTSHWGSRTSARFVARRKFGRRRTAAARTCIHQQLSFARFLCGPLARRTSMLTLARRRICFSFARAHGFEHSQRFRCWSRPFARSR